MKDVFGNELLPREIIKTKQGFYVDKYEHEKSNWLTTPGDFSCASLPKIYYDEEFSKWVLEFDSSDYGGYDVCWFRLLFDTKEEIYELLEKPEKIHREKIEIDF